MKENEYFNLNFLRNYVISLMPPHPIDYAVSEKQQEKEINLQIESLGNRRFFFVFNLENFKIEQKGGIEKWLGYSERDFSMKKFLDILQPGNRRTLIMVAIELYNSLCKGAIPLSLSMRFSSLIALKHSDGHYLIAQKISSPFQYDKKNCLTAHLDQFSIIGKYNGEGLSHEFFNIFGGSEEERAAQIVLKIKELFLKIVGFTTKEMEIIDLISSQENITRPRIEEVLDISVNTAKTHSKHILAKAKSFFDKKFTSVTEFVEYLKRERLI